MTDPYDISEQQVDERIQRDFLVRMGDNLRSVLNDIKRTPEAAADELGISAEEMKQYVSGEKRIPDELIRQAAETWPINERDLYVIRNDAPDGVRFMSRSESEATSRVFERGGEEYYEYRDTAMSRTALFRPEWIKELCVVEDSDPHNDRVQWNHGHLMHQFTYFVGPVNYYYEVDGEKHAVEMETGDSVYGTPFTPHTFTTRANSEGQKGLILAVTVGSKFVGRPQQELSAIGQPWAEEYALDFERPEQIQGELIEHHRSNITMPISVLAARSDVEEDRLEASEAGEIRLDPDEVASVADVLGIDRRALLPPDDVSSKIVVQKKDDAEEWSYPSGNSMYRLRGLADSPLLPHTRPLELTVEPGTEARPDIQCGLHQWCYVLSDDEVEFTWETAGTTRRRSLSRGDSFYLKPFVEHGFATVGDESKVLLMRGGGTVSGDPMRELSTYEDTERAIQETMQWYDPSGSD